MAELSQAAPASEPFGAPEPQQFQAHSSPHWSRNQQFNSETECAAQKLFSSKLQPNLTRRALRSLKMRLCMAAGIRHALPPA
ncbi:hypothetical protein ACRRTK_010434 [Alexandromys fortis]